MWSWEQYPPLLQQSAFLHNLFCAAGQQQICLWSFLKCLSKVGKACDLDFFSSIIFRCPWQPLGLIWLFLLNISCEPPLPFPLHLHWLDNWWTSRLVVGHDHVYFPTIPLAVRGDLDFWYRSRSGGAPAQAFHHVHFSLRRGSGPRGRPLMRNCPPSHGHQNKQRPSLARHHLTVSTNPASLSSSTKTNSHGSTGPGRIIYLSNFFLPYRTGYFISSCSDRCAGSFLITRRFDPLPSAI